MLTIAECDKIARLRTLVGLNLLPTAVQGHGVPNNLLATVLSLFKQFFALPDSDKRVILHDKYAKGYQPFGEQILDYGAQKQGDTKETWALMGNHSQWQTIFAVVLPHAPSPAMRVPSLSAKLCRFRISLLMLMMMNILA
eukprot:GHUV01031341.1.p1 GENE.GHUV01031341.1~~GHUV01031341.1.p1  ORF type:complete len:140 (+),score=5.71 GHUV01031341.1:259-678(+)